MALFYVTLNKVNLILAFTTSLEFFKLFCLYYTLTHMKYNIFELSLDEYYFQAHALDLVQSAPAFGRRPILPLQFLRPLTVFTDTYSPESTYSLILFQTKIFVLDKLDFA